MLTEEKAFSGEISSMMNTVSEDKSPIDLKNSIPKKTRNNMVELNKQFVQSKLSAIEELNMRYVK